MPLIALRPAAMSPAPTSATTFRNRADRQAATFRPGRDAEPLVTEPEPHRSATDCDHSERNQASASRRLPTPTTRCEASSAAQSPDRIVRVGATAAIAKSPLASTSADESTSDRAASSPPRHPPHTAAELPQSQRRRSDRAVHATPASPSPRHQSSSVTKCQAS